MSNPIKQYLYDFVVANPDKVKVTHKKDDQGITERLDWHDEVQATQYIPNGRTEYEVNKWKFCFVKVEVDETRKIKHEDIIHPEIGEICDVSEFTLCVKNLDTQEAFSIDEGFSYIYEENSEIMEDSALEAKFNKEIESFLLAHRLSNDLATVKPLSTKDQYLEDFAKQSNGTSRTKSGSLKI